MNTMLSFKIYSVAMLLGLLLAGCKTEPAPKPIVPEEIPEESIETPVQLPIVSDIYGALYSVKIRRIFNGTETRSELASAVFYETPSITTDVQNATSAGYVAVNNINLNQSSDGYGRVATEGQIIENLNYDQGVTWYVQGDDGIPPQTFSWTSKFPVYTGEFPAIIERSKGLKLTFDNTTLRDADSVYVAISAGKDLIVKRYSCDAGEIIIPAGELIYLQKCPADKPGYFQISPSIVDIFYLAGRATVLVKQYTEIRTVILK